MTALLLTLATFVAWWAIGLALLAALRIDTRSPAAALSAPILGTAVTVLVFFTLSYAGLPMQAAALPVTAVLLAGSVAVLAMRRPGLPRAVAPIVALCLLNLLLVGRPMLRFGFHWLANANGDMAYYALSATQLVHHGLLGRVAVAALAHDHGFASNPVIMHLHNGGGRPGAEIVLAAYSSLAGLPAYEVYMPLILAVQLCVVCGAGALAAQGARRSWAAVLAAALLVASPLAAYSVVQQLLPQVWGLGLAVTLFALLMRSELHRDPGPRVVDLVLIAILVAALLATYIELVPVLILAYGLYVAVLGVRREVDVGALARLWLPVVAIVLVFLNYYLIREIQYLRVQSGTGLASTGGAKGPQVFGYALVPGALPGLVGLQLLSPDPGARLLGLSILVAGVVVLVVLVAALATAVRGLAVSAIVVALAALGLALTLKGADRGVFKLFLYVQPFLAAGIAVWLARARTAALAVVTAPLVLLAVGQLSTQRAYVDQSEHPVDLRHASSADLLPAFRRYFQGTDQPVVSVTENPELQELEAASIGERQRLYFVTSNTFGYSGWMRRTFSGRTAGGRIDDPFEDNVHVSKLLSTGRCRLILPSGSQTVVNRRSLPDGLPDLVASPCRSARNVLIYTSSARGAGVFDFLLERKNVAYYQLEKDPFFRNHTFVGIGRFLLFRVVGPTARVRLELSLTETPLRESTLPRVAAVGATRVELPLVGDGSAHVFSAPFRPRLIAGQPYVLLDLGRDGRLPIVRRPGLQGLYGRSVVLDPRYLAGYVRGISLVGEGDYQRLRAPRVIERLPAALMDPSLVYSGIYEDRWIAQDSYAILSGGPASTLTVRAEVPPRKGQHLEVRVNGHIVASRNVPPGTLELQAPLPATTTSRRIELHWAGTIPLRAPDTRHAAALLKYLGVSRKAPH